MSQKKKSKEEMFVLKLYELAMKTGDPENEVDRYAVGKLVGEHTKGADHTVQLLTKNGFTKRGDGSLVYLTKGGVALAQELISNTIREK